MHGIASLQHVQKIKSYVGLLQGYEKQKLTLTKPTKNMVSAYLNFFVCDLNLWPIKTNNV
jgi:hypothetical protein